MQVRLRPLKPSDLDVLNAARGADNAFEFFGHQSSNRFARRFAEDGFLADDSAQLAIELADGTLAGSVGWRAVWYGPGEAGRAFNLGITLLAEHRGKGIGSAAQDEISRYLFEVTRIERIEAYTDIENLAEQRALEKAGFQREGIVRHAQYRFGAWHDMVLFSRLRGDEVALA